MARPAERARQTMEAGREVGEAYLCVSPTLDPSGHSRLVGAVPAGRTMVVLQALAGVHMVRGVFAKIPSRSLRRAPREPM